MHRGNAVIPPDLARQCQRRVGQPQQPGAGSVQQLLHRHCRLFLLLPSGRGGSAQHMQAGDGPKRRSAKVLEFLMVFHDVRAGLSVGLMCLALAKALFRDGLRERGGMGQEQPAEHTWTPSGPSQPARGRIICGICGAGLLLWLWRSSTLRPEGRRSPLRSAFHSRSNWPKHSLPPPVLRGDPCKGKDRRGKALANEGNRQK